MKLVLKVIECEGKRTRFHPRLKKKVNNLNLSEKYKHLHMVSYERKSRIIREFYALKDGETL